MNSCAAAVKGPSSFENYTDPQTGKLGNPNVGVTVGKFRDNQLVSRVHNVSMFATTTLSFSHSCLVLHDHVPLISVIAGIVFRHKGDQSHAQICQVHDC